MSKLVSVPGLNCPPFSAEAAIETVVLALFVGCGKPQRMAHLVSGGGIRNFLPMAWSSLEKTSMKMTLQVVDNLLGDAHLGFSGSRTLMVFLPRFNQASKGLIAGMFAMRLVFAAENVKLGGRSNDWAALHVAGAGVVQFANGVFFCVRMIHHVVVVVEMVEFLCHRITLTGPLSSLTRLGISHAEAEAT